VARVEYHQERVTTTSEEEFEAKLIEIGSRYIRRSHIAEAIFDLAVVIHESVNHERLEFEDLDDLVIEAWMQGWAFDHPRHALPSMQN
jgi:hypothetical protein